MYTYIFDSDDPTVRRLTFHYPMSMFHRGTNYTLLLPYGFWVFITTTYIQHVVGFLTSNQQNVLL